MKAFPNAPFSDQGRQLDTGMDLRDYFAAKAMQALLIGKYTISLNDLVVKAYATADEMMKAREQ